MNEDSMEASAVRNLESSTGMLIVLGILTLILGVLAMGAPLMTGVAVSMIVGILVVIGGIARTIFAFRAESWGQGILAFLLGALTVVCGLVMVGRPLFGLASLTLVLAAYFLVDGIFEIVAGFKMKPAPGWIWMVFGGVISALLGFMIWRQGPISGAWAIGILVGIKLVFMGFEMIFVGSAGGSVAKGVEQATA